MGTPLDSMNFKRKLTCAVAAAVAFGGVEASFDSGLGWVEAGLPVLVSAFAAAGAALSSSAFGGCVMPVTISTVRQASPTIHDQRQLVPWRPMARMRDLRLAELSAAPIARGAMKKSQPIH